MTLRRWVPRLCVFFLLTACAAPYFPPPESSDGFTNFETEPLRPLVLSDDGELLYALNTPDDRLEVFAAGGKGLRSIGEVRLGLRPIAMALRRPGELWVVNHLSDSVNVVNVSDPTAPEVVLTLPVGDEPRGIVAAGPERRWVIVAAARRDDTLKAGIGRAQLWVFDAQRPIDPPQIITLFGTKPRALAVSPDGMKVYAGIFQSGNRTASVGGIEAASIGRAPIYSLDNRPEADERPKAGAIVKQVGGRWLDFEGRDWSAVVPFDLPDYDVFALDASGEHLVVSDRITGVGTVLLDIAVRPDDGEVWVSNTEAVNLEPHEPRLRGRFVDNRITRLRKAGKTWQVTPTTLDPAIDKTPMSAALSVRERALAQPLQVVFEKSGDVAYVAAFGSRKVGILSRDGLVAGRVDVGFGPSGLALDENRERLYVFNRLDGSITVVDTRRGSAIATVPLRHDPTPILVKAGRPLLYDAQLSSGRGTLSCASCHVFADIDGLAWDLGNPQGELVPMPARLKHDLFVPQQDFHPLKGPMTTQSLRGLKGSGPLHWRGDRFGRDSEVPGEDIDSFRDFDRAFVDLMGLAEVPSDQEMEALARFVLTIRYPPNPNEPLDREFNSRQQAGLRIFNNGINIDRGLLSCRDCHSAPLGTNRLINFEGVDAGRDLKTAHLRNVYQKVGRFNQPGPQVSGFGLVHDGSLDTVVNFLTLDVFHIPGKTEEERDRVRTELNAFVMAFHTGMAASVGLQETVRGRLSADQEDRLDLMFARADSGDCDLTARGHEGKVERAWLWQGGRFVADRRGVPLKLEALLRRQGARPITFLCVPPGDGRRSALDRDLDGVLDGDEAGRY